MKKRCILHIGWHKTGTTALQDFLAGNAAALALHGVDYPTYSRNHSRFLPAVWHAAERRVYSAEFVPPLKGYETLPQGQAARLVLDDILAGVTPGITVFSAEDMCLLTEAEIRNCHKTLAAAFDQITVVAYLRGHASYAQSAFQQLLRMGFQASEIFRMASHTDPDAQSIVVLGPLPHYASRLANWARVFGAENLRLFNYDTAVVSQTDIRQHFWQVVLAASQPALADAPLRIGPRVNTSFSTTAAYVLNRMNEACPLFLDGARNPGFLFNFQHYLASLADPGFTAPVEFFDRAREGFDADLAALQDAGWRTVATPNPKPAKPRGPKGEPLFSGNQLLDSLATVVAQASADAINSKAREKLFAALNRLAVPAHRQAALGQVHVALFLMASQALLVSSGNWLLGAGEPQLARGFLQKARAFPDRPPGLTALAARLASSGA